MQYSLLICLSLLAILVSDVGAACVTTPIDPSVAVPLVDPRAVPANSTLYQLQIQAGSLGNCSVDVVDDSTYISESITRLHYWIVDTEGVSHRDAKGYQYFSRSFQSVRYDQTFSLELPYDETHVGAELYDVGSITNGVFQDISINAHTAKAVCFNAAVAFPPEFPIILTYAAEYLGTQLFPVGYFQTPGNLFDVYSVEGQWFAGATVYYFVDRSNGQVAQQLYHQSISGGPNYFRDFGSNLFTNAEAQMMFHEKPKYYFNLDKMVNRYCE